VSLNEDGARRLDQADPGQRELFLIPPAAGGPHPETAYLAGNSLGLQPKATQPELLEDLAAWAGLGVEGHLEAGRPWLPYHELLTGPAARLVGAQPQETVIMNSLTVNLHLLMVSFYRPVPGRDRILIEDSAFPSDSYAVRSQARFHGLNPHHAVVPVPPAQIADFLSREGESVALVLLGGVNYLTGELMDIAGLTELGQAKGAVVGWDLAHAAGNVPLRLHDWGVDFAAWCSYKYLNSGPGALAGAFVHERHLGRDDLPRFEGWWSTDPATRFQMAPVADPPPTVDAWQISNPPILAMGPVRTSLEIFDRIGMETLRERSLRLTGYLLDLLDDAFGTDVPGPEVVTPRDPARRGSQLSLRVAGGAAQLAHRLRHGYGVVADAREPDILRLAPAALYSSYHDCWRAVSALADIYLGSAQHPASAHGGLA
jgi:kynureninase